VRYFRDHTQKCVQHSKIIKILRRLEKLSAQLINKTLCQIKPPYSIKNLNRQIRKTTKNKLSFESSDRLFDYVFMAIKEFEEKNYMKYPIANYRYFKKVEKV